MNNFNWSNIRSYNNSQNNAFEELICQIAREEEIPNKKSFVRIGTPDGGVEAYCILDNGDEYGWQAKFFNKMEDSIKTGFDKTYNTFKHLDISYGQFGKVLKVIKETIIKLVEHLTGKKKKK